MISGPERGCKEREKTHGEWTNTNKVKKEKEEEKYCTKGISK